MSKIKFNWKGALGEIVYIFLGITLAIWFQNWNDDYKDQQEVDKILKTVLYQNKSNLKSLPETMKKTESVMHSSRSLMTLMGPDYQSKEVDLVDSLMFKFILTPQFNANEEAIMELIESDKLPIIKDYELRRIIVRWNLLKSKSEVLENLNIKQNIEQIMPYLQEHFSILNMDAKFANLEESLPPSAFQIDNREILADIRFENILEMQYYSMSYLHQSQQELLDLMKELDEMLEKMMK